MVMLMVMLIVNVINVIVIYIYNIYKKYIYNIIYIIYNIYPLCRRLSLRVRLSFDLLQELGKNNPQLLQLINSNQAEFLRLINEAPGNAPSAEEMAAQLAAAGGAPPNPRPTLLPHLVCSPAHPCCSGVIADWIQSSSP